MEITFEVQGATAKFTRNFVSGRAILELNGETVALQNPWNPATHLDIKLMRVWQVKRANHTIVIEKERPFLFPALRPHRFRVFVDNAFVTEKTGF